MHRIRRRNKQAVNAHTEDMLPIEVEGKTVWLKQIVEPSFGKRLARCTEKPIDYPDGQLLVLCGCDIGHSNAVFAIFGCDDCDTDTWYANTEGLKAVASGPKQV